MSMLLDALKKAAQERQAAAESQATASDQASQPAAVGDGLSRASESRAGEGAQDDNGAGSYGIEDAITSVGQEIEESLSERATVLSDMDVALTEALEDEGLSGEAGSVEIGSNDPDASETSNQSAEESDAQASVTDSAETLSLDMDLPEVSDASDLVHGEPADTAGSPNEAFSEERLLSEEDLSEVSDFEAFGLEETEVEQAPDDTSALDGEFVAAENTSASDDVDGVESAEKPEDATPVEAESAQGVANQSAPAANATTEKTNQEKINNTEANALPTREAVLSTLIRSNAKRKRLPLGWAAVLVVCIFLGGLLYFFLPFGGSQDPFTTRNRVVPPVPQEAIGQQAGIRRDELMTALTVEEDPEPLDGGGNQDGDPYAELSDTITPFQDADNQAIQQAGSQEAIQKQANQQQEDQQQEGPGEVTGSGRTPEQLIEGDRSGDAQEGEAVASVNLQNAGLSTQRPAAQEATENTVTPPSTGEPVEKQDPKASDHDHQVQAPTGGKRVDIISKPTKSQAHKIMTPTGVQYGAAAAHGASGQGSEPARTLSGGAAPGSAQFDAQQKQARVQVRGGYIDFQRGYYRAAERHYRRALALDPHNREAHLGLAGLAQMSGDLAEALFRYNAVLRDWPNDEIARAGMTSLSLNQNGTAIETELKSLMAQFPESPHLAFVLGNVYAGRQAWQAAQQQYFQAWTGDNTNLNYLYNLAVSLDQLGEYKSAISFYEKLIAQKPSKTALYSRDAVRVRLSHLRAHVQSRAGNQGASKGTP